MSNALLTGSLVYGTLTEKSDIDLVVLTDIRTLQKLEGQAEEKDSESYDADSASLRFGKLNLIVVTDPKDFIAWNKMTKNLIARAPVTREEAIKERIKQSKAIVA